ncbi:MAG: class I SAM-dependent methyltransferase [Alphaproteobacteria bacterium]|nr:class I SAM-dependent methyltransferase [Alphaproteobacteria bacterium]MBF0128392.1 class I SAM-dependent methyltransferase [Alphaproteobacteria bacterium]
MTDAATSLDYQGGELALFAHAVNWKRYFAAAVGPHLGGEVLEVGAGLGSTTQALCRGQSLWVCLEPDPAMVRVLHREVEEGRLPPACRVEAGTTSDLIARGLESAFDSVVYIDVLEHIEDDAGELRRAVRLLRPGGRLLVLSPAHRFLYAPFDAAIGHVRRYDRARMREITPEGTTPVTIRYLDSVGLLASLANRLLLRSRMPTQNQVLSWDRLMVPVSRLIDPLTGHTIGKSILAVWKR